MGLGSAQVSIELLLQHAIQQTGRLPWEGTRQADLAYDRGCTARPRTSPVVSWGLAEVCAGITHRGRSLRASKTPTGDAAIVLGAVKALAPRDASLVLACARAKRAGPEWRVCGLVEAEPQVRTVRAKRGHRRVPVTTWRDGVTPEAIRVARGEYQRWRSALVRLTVRLQPEIHAASWLLPPLAPWQTEMKISA